MFLAFHSNPGEQARENEEWWALLTIYRNLFEFPGATKLLLVGVIVSSVRFFFSEEFPPRIKRDDFKK